MKSIHSLMRVTMIGTFAIICACLAQSAYATEVKSSTERARFVRANPCPTTGLSYGGCQGNTVVHIQPLCKGGKSVASNMKWMSVADASARARIECKKK
jgi:hypothetical protein